VVERVTKIEMTFFIIEEGDSRTVRVGWPAVVVWIQCFNFGLRGEVTGRSVAERFNRGRELILAPWEGSVTRCGDISRRRGGTGEGKGRRRR
jgi:hypothetical protein